MFAKFISLLVLVAPLASALQLNTPEGVTSGGWLNISWISAPSDPATFTLELINVAFNSQFAVFNNVDPSLGHLNLQCPIVPATGGYTVQANDIGNITDIFATSGSFSIGATISSSSTSTGSGIGSGTASTSGTATGTNTNAPTTANLPITTATSSSETGSSSTEGTDTGSGTAASATPSNAAAVSSRLALTNACGYAVLLLSVVGGAVAVAL